MNADMDEGMGAGSAVAVAGKSMNKQGTPPVWLPSFTKGTNTDIRKAGNLKNSQQRWAGSFNLKCWESLWSRGTSQAGSKAHLTSGH